MDNLNKLDISLGAALGIHSAVSRVNITGYVTGVTTVKSVDSLAQGAAAGLPAAAAATTISSGSTSDTSAGTGARTVLVTGLDANYNIVSETATMNGRTGVTLTNQYLRVTNIEVQTAGSGGVNAGIIYVGTGSITTGVPANIIGGIAAGDNVFQAARYTVPTGQKLIMTHINVSTYDVDGTLGTPKQVQVDMKVLSNSTGLKRLVRRMYIPAMATTVRLNPALAISNKDDVWFEAVGSVGASIGVTAAGYLINGA